MTRRDHPELAFGCRYCLAGVGVWCTTSSGAIWRRSHVVRRAAARRPPPPRCPTCRAPWPHLHPAGRSCPDRWHELDGTDL